MAVAGRVRRARAVGVTRADRDGALAALALAAAAPSARSAPIRRWARSAACSPGRATTSPPTRPRSPTSAPGTRTSPRRRCDPRSDQIIDYINASGGDKLHPDFGSPREYGIPYEVVGKRREEDQGQVHRLRRRVRPRQVPGPAQLAGRGRRERRRRPPRARLRQGALQALRALPRLPAQGQALGRRRRRDLGPALGRPAPRRLDLGRRRRAADLPRAGPLRRGPRGRRSTTRSASPSTSPATPGCTRLALRRRRRRAPTRRRWGCACGCKAGYDISGITGDARVIAEALKRYGLIIADNGSNWFFQGSLGPALERRQPQPAQGDPGLGVRGRALAGRLPRLLSAPRSRSSPAPSR